MILLIDIGNSNIVFANYDSKIDNVIRINTRKDITGYEYGILLRSSLEKFTYEDVIISSVVPEVTEIIRQYVQSELKISPIIVGPGVKTGLNIKTDNPKEVGSDLIVDAVASFNHSDKALVVDLGTASKIILIEDRQLRGVIIAPGVRASLESLVKKTSLLPQVDLKVPKNEFGTNTVDCIQSGVLYGHAHMIDGFLANQKYKDYKVLVTGGFSSIVGPLLKTKCEIDEILLLKGLVDIYNRNKMK